MRATTSHFRVLPAAAGLALTVLASACGTPDDGIGRVHVFTTPAPAGDDALVERYRLTGARIGYVVEDLETGERLAARNADRLFIPASTAKVPTTVAALNVLGPGYRFETRLLAQGAPAQGAVEGDLYLQGTGDPLLQPQDLMGLAQRLKDLGVTRVTGGFLYDATFLTTVPAIDQTQPANARYNPGVGALSLDFNQTLLTWRRKDDDVVEAFETPAFEEAVPGLGPVDPGAGRDVVYAGPGTQSRWLLSPAAPSAGQALVPVKRPGLRTARVFRRLAKLIGVRLPEPAPAKAVPADVRVVASVSSAPLVDIVRQSLEHSNNLVAELIGQVAARRISGVPDTLARGAAAVASWFKARLPALDWTGYSLPNHSGLASTARASPAQMAAIVRFAAGQRYGGWSYPSLLPAAGLRESMGGRFRDPATALRVWAKTGTLKYATGLTGVLFTQQGRRLAFALYVTDFERRGAYDAADNPFAPDVAAAAEQWIDRAEAFEEDLIREWIVDF